MRAYGVVAILFSVLFCAPAVFAAVSHESAQIRGGVFGSDFGPQDFTVNGTLDLDTLRFIGESTSVTSISALSTLGGGSASNATLPTQWAVKAYVDAAIVGSGSMSNFTIAGDTGSSVVIDGQTVTVAGGTSITTSETGRTVTVAVTDDSIDGAQLADTITLDATLAFTQGTFDVNFDANTLFIDGSANRVGVGTTAPGASLDVDGNLLLQNGAAINEFSIDDTLSGNSDLAVPTEQAVKAYVDTAVSGLGSGSMSNFTLTADSGTSQLISQGNTLDIAGGTGISTVVGATDTVTVSITDDSIDGAQLADTITLDAVLAINGQDVNFDANTLFIDVSTNNIGIGDDTPDANLDVRGVSEAEGDVLIDQYEIKLLNSGQAHWSIFNNQTSGWFIISDTSASAAVGTLGTNRLVIDGSNVGIGTGTTTPLGRLQVVGDEVRIGTGTPGTATGDGDLFVTDALEVDGSIVLGANAVTGFATATDLGGGAASNSNLPTQLAVKTYVDAQVGGAGSMSNFTLTGDSGTAQLISQGNTLDIAGGTGISTVVGATDTVTVSITDDSIDGAQLADTITLDAVLAVNGQDVNFDANTLFVDVSANRVGVGTAAPGASLDVDGNLILQNGVAINEFSIDDTLSGNSDLAVPTEQAVKAYVDNAVSGLGSGSMSNFTLTGDSGTSQLISQGNTLDIAGGTSITTVVGATDTVTIDVADDSIDGSELADTITLDATLAITQGSLDVNFDANTLFIDGSANRIGIGTNAPGQTLDVDGNARIDGSLIVISTTAGGYPTQLSVDDNTDFNTRLEGTMAGGNDYFRIRGNGTSDAGQLLIYTGDNGNEPIIFAQQSGTTFNERLRIDSSGRLTFPIGTAINEFSIDDTLAGDSDLAVPTEQAVKAYVDNAVSGLGSGDVGGPASSTDNAIARFDGTGGKTVQNSGVTISDTNSITGVVDLTATGTITGATIDTGQGATEVYAMNQDVETTDAVTFSTVTAQGQNLIVCNTASIGSAGWYRIASNGPVSAGGSGGSRAHAMFTVIDTQSSRHSSTTFYASVHYGNDPTLTLLSRSSYGSNGIVNKIRLVEGGVYEGAAVEIYIGSTGPVEYCMYDNIQSSGWTAESWTAGSIPSGFAATQIDLDTYDPVFATASDVNNNAFYITRTGAVSAASFVATSGATINEFSTDTTLAGSSNTAVPTEAAVKSYIDTAIAGTGSMNGFTLAGDSGTSPINDSDTLDVAGGTAITTSVSGDTVTVGVTPDSIDGAQLADTITLDATLAITQGSLDVNFDANTLVVDGSANRVGIGTAAPSAKLDVVGDIEVSDRINHAGTGVVQEFSNGCTMTANATGLYWNC